MSKTKQAAKPARKRADWEAIERDYRTGRFTLRELEAKHGAAYATIGQRAKREGWTQDLRDAVRQATRAKLVEAITTQAITQGTHAVTQTVLEAAEVNKQVILKHRRWLSELANDAATLREKVLGMVDDVADVREAAVAVGAIEALTRTTKTLIDKEREAFSLNDAETPADPAPRWKDIPEGAAYEGYLRMTRAG